VANITLSSLLEPFAIAAGILPSTWQTVPGYKVAAVHPDENRDPYRSGQQARISLCTPINEESAGDPDLPAWQLRKVL